MEKNLHLNLLQVYQWSLISGDELVGVLHHINVAGNAATPIVRRLECFPHDPNKTRGALIKA